MSVPEIEERVLQLTAHERTPGQAFLLSEEPRIAIIETPALAAVFAEELERLGVGPVAIIAMPWDSVVGLWAHRDLAIEDFSPVEVQAQSARDAISWAKWLAAKIARLLIQELSAP